MQVDRRSFFAVHNLIKLTFSLLQGPCDHDGNDSTQSRDCDWPLPSMRPRDRCGRLDRDGLFPGEQLRDVIDASRCGPLGVLLFTKPIPHRRLGPRLRGYGEPAVAGRSTFILDAVFGSLVLVSNRPGSAARGWLFVPVQPIHSLDASVSPFIVPLLLLPRHALLLLSNLPRVLRPQPLLVRGLGL